MAHKACLAAWGMRMALALQAQPSDPWTPKEVIQPAALAKILRNAGEKPAVLQVGFQTLYEQGHIPGSLYCGPASNPDGIDRLKSCVAKIPKTSEIILYCGCCPWERCPNIRPAFRALGEMGFRNLRVLLIAHTLGKDWVQRGYPTVRGSSPGHGGN